MSIGCIPENLPTISQLYPTQTSVKYLPTISLIKYPSCDLLRMHFVGGICVPSSCSVEVRHGFNQKLGCAHKSWWCFPRFSRLNYIKLPLKWGIYSIFKHTTYGYIYINTIAVGFIDTRFSIVMILWIFSYITIMLLLLLYYDTHCVIIKKLKYDNTHYLTRLYYVILTTLYVVLMVV